MAFHPQPLFFLVLGLIAGTLVPLDGTLGALRLALGMAGLLAGLAIVVPRRVPLVALIVSCAAVGAALSTSDRVSFQAHALPDTVARVQGAVMVEGVVASDPRIADEEMRVDIDATALIAEGVRHAYRGHIRLFVRSLTSPTDAPARRAVKGDGVKFWAELRAAEAVRSPGGFDQLEWATREGIHGFATCKTERLLQIVSETDARIQRDWLDQVRDRLKLAWRHVPGDLDRAVTASMVLGDEGSLDATTRDEFRAAGLLHLLVVSGSQVAALILGLRRLMPRKLRLNALGGFIEAMALASYCALAGADSSVVRATLMAMAFALAVRVDLHRGGANFLAASALLLLSARPLDALDPGAQMSFAATLALVLFATPVSRRLEGWRVPGFLADVFSATMVATIAVAPIAMFHFHRFSIVSLPANLLAAPLAVILLYGSLTTALLDLIFIPGASMAGWICGLAAEALRGIAHHAAAMDPDWRGPSPPLVLILGFVCLILLSEWRRTAVPAAFVLAALTMSGLPLGDGRLHFWFLDVGQGDALVIETPTGRAVAVDAGPAFEKFDAGERIVGEALWTLGYQRLDFLAVTHRHADHEGGAPFIARHFKPARIYVTGPSSSMKDFAPSAVRRGASWTVDGVSFRVLSPDDAWPIPSRDENARSLVIEVQYGRTKFLLTGDASALTERFLSGLDERYEVVKVGHHGAATSSSAPFVQATRPRLALISVGARNRFSHPNPGVVERWSRAGALVWRTDLRKTLHLVSDGSDITWQ
ncbi:MAG: DNA internalization-related competence protein ComEC/Rec2 [Vicinamibacteria bacterium]